MRAGILFQNTYRIQAVSLKQNGFTIRLQEYKKKATVYHYKMLVETLQLSL